MASVQIQERRDESTIICRVKWTAESGESVACCVFVSATVDEVEDDDHPSEAIRQAAIVKAKHLAEQFRGFDA